MSEDDFEWDKFETAIQFLKKGVKTLFFRDVIKAATGKKVLPFNQETLLAIKLVDNWIGNNISSLSNTVYTTFKGRANEVGNKVEDELRNGLNRIPGLVCDKPLLTSGKKQATGYPDCIIDYNGNKIYADIKAYQTKTADSSLRSFFYQPTNKNKINFDAPHCIIGFETQSIGGDNKSPFKVIDYKIIDVYNLKVAFKAEFNAGNLELYTPDKLL